MHYGPLGTLLTWIFGISISYFTGGQNLNELNVNLLSPGIKKLLPKRYRHTQLQLIMMNTPTDTQCVYPGQPVAKDWLWKNYEIAHVH